jgi:hypothetical protein
MANKQMRFTLFSDRPEGTYLYNLRTKSLELFDPPAPVGLGSMIAVAASAGGVQGLVPNPKLCAHPRLDQRLAISSGRRDPHHFCLVETAATGALATGSVASSLGGLLLGRGWEADDEISDMRVPGFRLWVGCNGRDLGLTV